MINECTNKTIPILHRDGQDPPKTRVLKDFINTPSPFKHWNVFYFPHQEDSLGPTFVITLPAAYISYLVFTILTLEAGFIFPINR